VIQALDRPDAVDRAAAAEVAVIYKHSPRCGSSKTAELEVGRFAERHPDVPVYQLDVVRHRALARGIAERLDVRHESPQVILLRRGRVAWVGSHGEVDATAIEAQVRACSAA
jgi:bacillithiol system protein YtxJ